VREDDASLLDAAPQQVGRDGLLLRVARVDPVDEDVRVDSR
jgi:hypothetical protein